MNENALALPVCLEFRGKLARLYSRDKMRKTIYSKEGRALSKWLTRKRRVSGRSQREFAKVLKVHHSIVGKIEKGNRRIDVVELMQYCEALDVDPRDAIDEITKIARIKVKVKKDS